MSPGKTFDVAVAGGVLRACRWGDSGPVVVAAHGVTANHRTWALVAEHCPDLMILAPDLRGRGRSSGLPGPYGMAAHADDLARLLDAAGVDSAVVAGHSMGGFVAGEFAARYPDRTAAVALFDGGLPFPDPPPGMSTEEVLAATIGPAADRLSMTFASRADYLDFWRPHPALGPHWSAYVENYLIYDLEGTPPDCHPSASVAAVRADSEDILDSSKVDTVVSKLPPGTVFVRAGSGMMAEPTGLYPQDLVTEHARRYPHLEVRQARGSNHYTLLLADPGAQLVAETLKEVAAR